MESQWTATQWAAVYLGMSLLSYYALHMQSMGLEFRLDHSRVDSSSSLKFLLTEHREMFRRLLKDFFQIHCPWSKQTSIKYRAIEAHGILQYSEHEKGWRAEDCHDPAKHEQIAHDCFQCRSKFWAHQLFIMLTSPIRIMLIAVIAVVVMIVLTVVMPAKAVFARIKRA